MLTDHLPNPLYPTVGFLIDRRLFKPLPPPFSLLFLCFLSAATTRHSWSALVGVPSYCCLSAQPVPSQALSAGFPPPPNSGIAQAQRLFFPKHYDHLPAALHTIPERFQIQQARCGYQTSFANRTPSKQADLLRSRILQKL
ncbi:hypothetical protein HPP92_012780 [Vanilla planifolia]|uniref:Uncharacterized protein n=1 Tax=Vanilla planifolia TaxID=51239 RepID=A0A835QNQ1_VANPL|nr:hypothetical protein HPP92_012780 [Vanilla planifolia]